ncbi:MAG: DJ-1/PfpI family protein [Turneriella sp.]|nr:DJ-1/PfpI family protein [Turneriella sp.]
MQAEVVVLLAEGFEEIEAVTIIDTLRRAEIPTLVAAIGTETKVMGGHGIAVVADVLLSDISEQKPRLVVLPGGGLGVKNLKSSALAREFTARAPEIAAICAAPSALAEWSLLRRKTATCYPGFEQILRDNGAEVTTRQVVKDGNVTTSRGPGTALEFALQLVENLRGAAVREKLAQQMLVQAAVAL